MLLFLSGYGNAFILRVNAEKKYLKEHGTNSYFHRKEGNPFASKIVCGECNKIFARKGW